MKQPEIDDGDRPELNLYPLWDFLDAEARANLRKFMGKSWQPPQYRPALENTEEIQDIMKSNQDVER